MSRVKPGDTVSIHYTGLLAGGEVFDSSTLREEPVEFVVGEKRLLAGLEAAVVGMEEGEVKRIDLPPEEAYGRRDEELVQEVPLTEFPGEMELYEGMRFEAPGEDGAPRWVTVREIGPTAVLIDANHPLADVPVIFDIELLEIISA